MDGSIFWDLPAVFGHVDPTTSLEMHYSMVPPELCGEVLGLGVGNICADPLFEDSTGDFSLKPDSPAINTGVNGLDMGAMVASGASISGEPPAVTYLTSATLTVDGPGITHYIITFDTLDNVFV